MTVTHTWSYQGSELAWLRAALAPSDDRPGHVVAELVPGGFAAYLRIFHRFEAADGSGRTRRRRDLAQESGAHFHGELSHHRLRGADRPAVRYSPLDRLESVRADMRDGHAHLVGPEFWWPQDRSWVVAGDYDPVSGFVGCSTGPAERILAEPGIEALPVTLRTRVDFASDRRNRPSEM
ncbi:hypothetical protein [Kitasatospora herbaricolor]|uniref:Uncharacterized protein n=1 Tax=Kitasatospora herbaricolor TaxID=68217 RepID=A0ABZ1W966_9ACTN|nr:hypothetical protein [Kitasatospora herbaricolor]